MRITIKTTDIRSIEHVAMCLLAANISFEYNEDFLKVKNSNIFSGLTASYHVGDGHLCLMDSDYNAMTVEEFVEIIKPELKPLAKLI